MIDAGLHYTNAHQITSFKCSYVAAVFTVLAVSALEIVAIVD